MKGLVLLRISLDRGGSKAFVRVASRGPISRHFDRLGLRYRIVFAIVRSHGGSGSEEFPRTHTPLAEDTFVYLHRLRLCANV
jgi:prolyl-tRNA synthetase